MRKMKMTARINRKKLINTIINCIFCVSVTIILLSAISIYKDGTPSILGYRILRVASASMEPTLMTGDFVLAKIVKEPSDIEEGDIVTYLGKEKLHTITHRVIDISDEGYTFKGDNNPSKDSEVVPYDRLLYKVILCNTK